MVNVIFAGNVSFQVQAGETVTLTVTKPDATTDIFVTTTLADGTYTVTRAYDIAGNYSVIAHIGADATYKAADSASVPFIINLQNRTITVTVTIA